MSEALEVKKEGKAEGWLKLSTGVRARVMPVPSAVLEDALARLKPPAVPLWHNPDKDRDEENPADPDYLAAVRQHQIDQFRIMRDVFAIFGLEVEVPPDDAWVRRLRLAERQGAVDLAGYDLDDPVDREFVYKRYVALGRDDDRLVSRVWGVVPEEVDAAADFFRGDEAREPD